MQSTKRNQRLPLESSVKTSGAYSSAQLFVLIPLSVSLVSLHDLAAQSRWFTLQASMVAETVTMQAPDMAGRLAGGGGRRGSTKQCVCSPTRHPGSFRCKHHHGEYVWGGQVTRAQPSN
ncbi:hypothetical protein L1049_000637 [Liquidambar formosana]|uniref:Uncharacterized protein n=1 Tax=Liquidambar formosana TaxID=63359 RepID=A0AAP0R344_LIQFO